MLINCAAYQAGRKIADLSVPDIRAYLNQPACFVWVALKDATPAELAQMQEEFDLHELAVEDARNGHQRPKLEEYGDTLFCVLHVLLLDAIAHLYGGRVPGVCVGMQEYYRDVYDHLARIVKSVESVRDMLSTAIQVNLAMISLDDSAVSKNLAAYAALFAVPTMIAGVYGMNFQHMPELAWQYAYPAVLVVMVALDLGLWLRFRKAGWL